MEPTTKKMLVATVVLFLFSGLLIFIGASFKLQDWPLAGPVMIAGIGLNVLSYLLAGIVLVRHLKRK